MTVCLLLVWGLRSFLVYSTVAFVVLHFFKFFLPFVTMLQICATLKSKGLIHPSISTTAFHLDRVSRPSSPSITPDFFPNPHQASSVWSMTGKVAWVVLTSAMVLMVVPIYEADQVCVCIVRAQSRPRSHVLAGELHPSLAYVFISRFPPPR